MPEPTDSTNPVLRWWNHNRHEHMVFAGYVGTGILTQGIDWGAFLALSRTKMPVEVAYTIAVVLATTVQFTLSKYVNFRNHDRPVAQQLGTYLTVGAASLILSLAIVSALSRGMHLPPVIVKFVAISIAFPFNYVCHKYLTFAGGFRGTFAAWQAARRAKRVASTL